MTAQEAIQEIKRWTGILMNAGSQCVMDTAEAQEMAISALEEIQQYWALGTVEELRVLKESTLSGLELANIWAALRKLKKYETIGTVEELREAREKQKPIQVTDIHIDEYYCPACGAENNCDQGIIGDRFCPNCGQAIDQGGEE